MENRPYNPTPEQARRPKYPLSRQRIRNDRLQRAGRRLQEERRVDDHERRQEEFEEAQEAEKKPTAKTKTAGEPDEDFIFGAGHLPIVQPHTQTSQPEYMPPPQDTREGRESLQGPIQEGPAGGSAQIEVVFQSPQTPTTTQEERKAERDERKAAREERDEQKRRAKREKAEQFRVTHTGTSPKAHQEPHYIGVSRAGQAGRRVVKIRNVF